MPKYRYAAVDQAGKKFRGEMQAKDEMAVYDTLREQGKFLTSCKELDTKKGIRKLKLPVLATFCRQLGTLLRSGVSLVRALHIIAEDDTLKQTERDVFKRVLTSIRKGQAFSDSLEEEIVFPPLMVNMFRSAENSGNLDETALRMADHFDREHRLNSKVRNAMVYPIILLVMMVGIIIFVSAYILPQFSDLFSAMGELPILTRMMMGFSDLIVGYWYLLILGVVMLVVLGRATLAVPSIRLWFDKRKLHAPIIGKLLRTLYTARFARTLNSLYSSGIAILTALPVAVTTVGNQYVASQFGGAIASLQQGGTLAESLDGIDGFEKRLISSIRVGEEAGNLDEMLRSTADSYDFSAEQSLNRLVALVEPVMLIIMGILICLVMLGVLLPIFDSYNAIEQSSYY